MTISRTSAADGHILIGGTGRAGTTLLVQYFTALGFDTGFDLDTAIGRVDAISHAGLEHSLGRTLARGEAMPYVAKSPWFGQRLAEYLDRGDLTVKACIIPMRSLFEAAESRRAVSRRAAEVGLDPKHPGGVLKAKRNPNKGQEKNLAVQFYKLSYALASHAIPVYLLKFPDFAVGRQSLFQALRPLLTAHGVTEEESRAALARVVRVELINKFENDEVSRDGG